MRICYRLLFALTTCSPGLWAQQIVQTTLPNNVVRYENVAAKGQPQQFWKQLWEMFGAKSSARPFDRSIAFLVGVGAYDHISTQLKWVDADLMQLREVLLSKAGFDIVYVVRDKVATAELVEDYMVNRFPKELTSRDRLLFFFSGHGADYDDGAGYMQFSGAEPGRFSVSQCLQITRCQRWSRRNPASHMLFLFDCCFSGLGFEPKDSTSASEENLMWTLSSKGSRYVLTAGTAEEKSYQIEVSNKEGYSVLTRALTDVLNGRVPSGSGTGFLTLEDVFAALKREVGRVSSGVDRKMTPRMWPIPRDTATDIGTFIFLDTAARKPQVSDRIMRTLQVLPKQAQELGGDQLLGGDQVVVQVYRSSPVPGRFVVGAKVALTPLVGDEPTRQPLYATVDASGVAQFKMEKPLPVALSVTLPRGNGMQTAALPGAIIKDLPWVIPVDVENIAADAWFDAGKEARPVLSISREAMATPSISTVLGETKYAAENAPWGRPHAEVVIHRLGYSLGYNPATLIPRWVSYRLSVRPGWSGERPSGFEPDPLLKRGAPGIQAPIPRAEDSDYVRSGYSRGHMVSAEDMIFRGRKAIEEAFYLSAVAPQVQYCNGGPWARLEQYARDLAAKTGDLFITAGPAFLLPERKGYLTIGQNGVAVPTHFFRVIVRRRADGQPEALAFLVPNSGAQDFKAMDGGRDPALFLVSLAEVEQHTDLNFFPEMPPAQKAALLREKATRLW